MKDFLRLELPVLPLRNTVVLPHTTTGVDVGRSKSKRAVEEATGLVAERHLIFTLEGVARVVDAVGGVEVYLDRPMRYVDRAANLYIDFPAGRLHLSGEEAVKYMRFRHDALGDYARLDRIKAVATPPPEPCTSTVSPGRTSALTKSMR